MNNNKISRTSVTSSDCVLPQMVGKFDLVFYVSQRARSILYGSHALVEGFESPKNHSILVALEEIRSKKLTFKDMLHSLAMPDAENQEKGLTDAFLSDIQSHNFDDSDEDEDDDIRNVPINYKAEEEYQD